MGLTKACIDKLDEDEKSLCDSCRVQKSPMECGGADFEMSEYGAVVKCDNYKKKFTPC